MRNFAKSVLNYFATYTETRFRFDKRNLAYQWLAVQVDFDESNIGPKKFGKALSVCAEAAIKAVNGLAK